MTTPRLMAALLCYLVLALLGLALTSREARLIVWIFLAGVAVKSLIAWKAERLR